MIVICCLLILAPGRKSLILPLFLEIGVWENTVQCHSSFCSYVKSLIPITSCFLLLFTRCLGRRAGKRVGWTVADLFSFAYRLNWRRTMAPGTAIMLLYKQFKVLLAQMGVGSHVASSHADKNRPLHMSFTGGPVYMSLITNAIRWTDWREEKNRMNSLLIHLSHFVLIFDWKMPFRRAESKERKW